jgi:hypothetical protein
MALIFKKKKNASRIKRYLYSEMERGSRMLDVSRKSIKLSGQGSFHSVTRPLYFYYLKVKILLNNVTPECGIQNYQGRSLKF